MRFLVDECTGPAVARWLREQGHDVFSVLNVHGGWMTARPSCCSCRS
jgi:predicted nuclease of predicted toxin-antitoxin system